MSIEISKAFIKAQTEMSNAKKGANNPFFKSKYADLNAVLEAVLPALHSNGIAVMQPMETIEGKSYVKTVLIHESGETLSSLTEILYSKQNDAQAQGSGITYARRYGLQALCGIGAEDDDANLASKKQPEVSNSDRIKTAATLEALAEVWQSIPKSEQPGLLAAKNLRKEELTPKTPTNGSE